MRCIFRGPREREGYFPHTVCRLLSEAYCENMDMCEVFFSSEMTGYKNTFNWVYTRSALPFSVFHYV